MVRGDLAIFPLLSVMQMLLSSGRAGRFSVEHPRGGALWLDPGEVIHAQAGSLSGEAALQMLASLDGGQFQFEPNLIPPSRTLALRRDATLRRMLDDNEAWIVLLRSFPDWEKPVRFTARWNDSQPVTRNQYRALSLIPDGVALRTLLDRSGLPPRQVLDTLKPFLTAGLIEVG
jgi:hypothetical protein